MGAACQEEHKANNIPLLAAHFVRMFAERQGKVIDDIPDDIMDLQREGTPGAHFLQADFWTTSPESA